MTQTGYAEVERRGGRTEFRILVAGEIVASGRLVSAESGVQLPADAGHDAVADAGYRMTSDFTRPAGSGWGLLRAPVVRR